MERVKCSESDLILSMIILNPVVLKKQMPTDRIGLITVLSLQAICFSEHVNATLAKTIS